MLCITRRTNESIRIGDDILIVPIQCNNGRVRLGIVAPKHIRVLRTELENIVDPKLKSVEQEN
jgi:carbon storage regulator